MQKIFDGKTLALGTCAVMATGGLLLLPVGLAFLCALSQQRAEIEKGEMKDAENY